jgi:hypothetical protein
MEIQARRTLEKNGIDSDVVFGQSPLAKRQKSTAERIAYGFAIFGMVAGVFNFAMDPGWMQNVLLIVLGASCCLIWFLDREGR